MLHVLSSEMCKKTDSDAINRYKIPSIILMENAANMLLNEVKESGKTFLIICGKGNNGGDALALARKLILLGYEIQIVIVSKDNHYSNEFKINYDILVNMLSSDKIMYIKSEGDVNTLFLDYIRNYDVVIDGLFGVGLNRNISGMYELVIKSINLYGKKVISIDVPSGLDCDYGKQKVTAIKADETISFEVMKKGYLNYEAFKYIGKLKIVPIGIPNEVKDSNSENVYILDNSEYKKLIPQREIYGHKGTYGRALILAGSKGYTGAAYIATECTIRTGAGLTTLICPEEIQSELSGKLIEAMTITYDNEKLTSMIKNADSIAMGPGLGINKKSEKMIEYVINNSTCPLIIDADAIRILAGRKDLIKKVSRRAVFTPHPGEMSAFIGKSIDEIENNRIKYVADTAKKYNIIVLLKGYNTVISNGDETYINPTGNSKMASGGMGDSLTGIINGLCAQKIDVLKAVLFGAFIHGYIGDKLGKENYIVNARDIILKLPKFINEVLI